MLNEQFQSVFTDEDMQNLLSCKKLFPDMTEINFDLDGVIKQLQYSTILNPGPASSAAEDLKRRKYPQLVADFEFVPVAVETSGIIGSAGCSLLTDIGRRISRATNDPRQMSYIFQKISVAIIRGNALAITASSRKYVQELVEIH